MDTQIQTMKDIIDYAACTYTGQTAFRYKIKKEVHDKTYQEVKQDSEAFSRALVSLGMQKKHVAVIGSTTYEWIISYFGTVNSGSVIVPLDAGLPAEDICELLNRADISVLVYDELRKDAASMAREKCPALRYFISMQAEQSVPVSQAVYHSHENQPGQEGAVVKTVQEKLLTQTERDQVISLHRLLESHAGEFSCEPDPDCMCAILFTSGTTGKSKGVMLTHRNLTDNAVCLDMGIPAGTVSMTVLPVHHAYCFTMDILKGIYIGLTICINDSIMHVAKNIKLFQPEIILMVPMIVESVYRKLQEAGGLMPKKLVARAAFGGKLKTICSGGAYLAPELVSAFADYGITVLQGYGMTECSPVISTNLAGEAKEGSVGKLLPNCQAKEIDGELWVKGSSVMLGYYKMPEETAKTLVDGWLKTGDLGYVDKDGYVFLTGRRKNLIILSNGENISPEELENILSKEPLVNEVLVREYESVIQAVIFPDLEYAAKKHIKDVPGKLQEIIDKYNQGLPLYKKIRSLKVRDQEFEKTTSKKIIRNADSI